MPRDDLASHAEARSSAGNAVDPITAASLVCVVDDDAGARDLLTVLLEALCVPVVAYASGAQFLADQQRKNATCLIIDQHMPGMDGLDVVAALQREGRLLPTILVTGRLDAMIARRAEEIGIHAVLEKPLPTARLVALVDRAPRERS